MFYTKVMKIENKQTFKGAPLYNITAGLENNVLLNKALFDITGSDVPWVVMANNKEERRERLNRATLSFSLIFVSPLLALPLINRFAMKNVAQLTPKLFSKQYNAIRLSNMHLKNKDDTQRELLILGEKLKIDFKPTIDSVGSDFEKLRLKLIKAKNTVLASDFLLVTGTFGNIGFYNSWQTKKKTGQKGFSAEMKMAEKSIVEKRAEKYERSEKIRYGAFLATLASIVVALPLAIKHGLSSDKASKFNDFVKKHAHNFDYTDAIFMKRLPLAVSLAAAHVGINLASRNKTELKDNSIRSSTSFALFFGGDILLSSLFGMFSDRVFKTNIINKEIKDKNFLNRILPPPRSLKELQNIGHAKSKNIEIGLFWLNFAITSALMGFVTPYLINKIIKKDVAKDAVSATKTDYLNRILPKSKSFKQFQGINPA